jgi:hypothetical protein
LTGQNLFVFYEGTTAAGIPLNDEKFGMLYGNDKNRVGRESKWNYRTWNKKIYLKKKAMEHPFV